jgi:hypothetical protein
VEAFHLPSPRGPHKFQRPFPKLTIMNLAGRGRTYEFVSQIYGGLENLGGDAEGKEVAGEVIQCGRGKGAENIVVEVVVGGASDLSRGPSCVGGRRGGGLGGGVRQFGGIEGNVVESCTGPCGCREQLGDKET